MAALDQTQIEIAPAPGAIGRWDRDHEIAAYRNSMGDLAYLRQKRLAEQAKECTCGKQARADEEARANEVKPRKLLGNQHKPGCNSYSNPEPKLAPKISEAEQIARYDAGRKGGT